MAKILIIEDDALLLRMYQKIFTTKYDVETAADGSEGLEKARSSKPTLILLDVMMPKMNGLEVLQQLKTDPEISHIPVIVLTNLAGDHDAETALSMGAVRYIVKSEHKPKEIEDIVSGILAGYTRNEVPGS